MNKKKNLLKLLEYWIFSINPLFSDGVVGKILDTNPFIKGIC